MKTPAERASEYPIIRDEIWKIFESKGYYPKEIAGPLSNMLVELCILTSDKPMMDINRICKAMTADVRELQKSLKEEVENAFSK